MGKIYDHISKLKKDYHDDVIQQILEVVNKIGEERVKCLDIRKNYLGEMDYLIIYSARNDTNDNMYKEIDGKFYRIPMINFIPKDICEEYTTMDIMECSIDEFLITPHGIIPKHMIEIMFRDKTDGPIPHCENIKNINVVLEFTGKHVKKLEFLGGESYRTTVYSEYEVLNFITDITDIRYITKEKLNDILYLINSRIDENVDYYFKKGYNYEGIKHVSHDKKDTMECVVERLRRNDILTSRATHLPLIGQVLYMDDIKRKERIIQ